MGAILKLAYGNYNYQCECTSTTICSSAHSVQNCESRQLQTGSGNISVKLDQRGHRASHPHTARFVFYCQSTPPSPLVVMAANKGRIKKEKNW